MTEAIKNRCNIEDKKGEEENCIKENEKQIKTLKESLSNGKKFELKVNKSEIILDLENNTPKLSNCISPEKIESFHLKNSRGHEYTVKHNGSDWMIFEGGKITNERAKIYTGENIISSVILKTSNESYTTEVEDTEEESSHIVITPDKLNILEKDKTYNLKLPNNKPRLSDCISPDKIESFHLKNSRGHEYIVKHNDSDWMIVKDGKLTNERAKIYKGKNIISNVILKTEVEEKEVSHILINPDKLNILEKDKTYNLQLKNNTPKLSNCISPEKVESFHLKNSRGNEYIVKHDGSDWMIVKYGKLTNERAKIYKGKNIISNVILKTPTETAATEVEKNNNYFDYEKLLPTKTEDLGISGHMRFLEENNHESFEKNIVNGKIGEYFKGKDGVLCATFTAKMINHFVVLPDGKVAAGDAWHMIENMKKQGTMKEIYRDHEIKKPTKAQYNEKYKEKLYKAYSEIKERFKKSKLPMIAGVHYAYTETDLPNGLLTKALKENKIKTSPNSHVLFVRDEYTKKFNINPPKTLKEILINHLKENKHNKVPLDKIDWDSELLKEIKIYKDNSLIGNVKDLLGQTFSGEIVLKGIGAADEMNQSVKTEFLALAMSKIARRNEALFTMVQVGQVQTKKLLSDEKNYKEVLNGISLKEVALIETFKEDKYQKIYNEQIAKFKSENPTIAIEKVKKIIKGRVLEKIKNDLIYNIEGESINPQSPLGRDINFYYTNFFKKNKVSENTVLPIFTKKSDLLTAINRFKKTLETDETLENNIKLEIGIDKIKTTNDLMRYFITQEPFNSIDIDINNPQIRKIFFMFFIKLAYFNKGSYFSDKIFEMEKEITKSRNKEIKNIWFANKNPYNLYYNKLTLNDLFNQIKKINENIESNKETERNELFEDIPMDYLVEKLEFPFNTNQLAKICDDDSQLMRALVMIAYKEWYQGTYRYNGSYISELSRVKDNIISSAVEHTSSGILQLRLPPQNDILMQRGKSLVEKMEHLQSSTGFTLSEIEIRYFNDLKKGIENNNINRGIFRSLIRVSPLANFSLGAIYLKEKHSRIKYTTKKHLLNGEPLKRKTVYDYMIISHSSEVLAPHQMNIGVLDKVIHNYGLSKNPVWNTLDKREKSIKSPVLKGKLRIELMTRLICEEILKNSDIKKDFVKSAKEMEINLEDNKKLEKLIFEVIKDVNRSKDKTMMELGVSGKYYFKNYALFFKILRNIDPDKFSIEVDHGAIADPKRKQMGNYWGSTITDFNKMIEESMP